MFASAWSPFKDKKWWNLYPTLFSLSQKSIPVTNKNYLDENWHVSQILSIESVEGSQQLETLRVGVNIDFQAGAIRWWSLVGVHARVKSVQRQLVSERAFQLEFLAVSTDELICGGIETKVTGNGEGGHHLRRGDESVCHVVGVVTPSEVSVVWWDDSVLLTFWYILSVYWEQTDCKKLGEE